MSGADDLRIDIEGAIDRGFLAKGPLLERICDEVMAVVEQALADPVRRLAILEAMGLDFREGVLTEQRPGEWRAYPRGTIVPLAAGGPCLVVRPRGEATE